MRYNHYPGHGIMPGYEADRDTQFTRNAEAIKHYIDNSEIEMKIHGKWTPISRMDSLQPFHFWPAHPTEWTKNPAAITVEAAYRGGGL